MSLERAYRNCCFCQAMVSGDQRIHYAMDEAMKALEEERNYPNTQPEGLLRKGLADVALTACIRCDRKQSAIAKVLDDLFPELWNKKGEEKK